MVGRPHGSAKKDGKGDVRVQGAERRPCAGRSEQGPSDKLDREAGPNQGVPCSPWKGFLIFAGFEGRLWEGLDNRQTWSDLVFITLVAVWTMDWSGGRRGNGVSSE